MKLEELLSPDLYAQVKARIDEVNGAEPNKAKYVRFADLSDGGFISVDKFNDRVNTLTQQVTDLQGQITQRDTDMTDLQGKLTAAQADAGKLADVQTAFTTLQTKYSADQQAWEQKTQKQAYEFRVREKANGLKFTSPAAKRDFVREATAKDFKIDGDTLLGYEDFIAKYKADNPGALAEEAPSAEPNAPKPPTIVLPKGGPKPPDEKDIFGFHFNGVRPKEVKNE